MATASYCGLILYFCRRDIHHTASVALIVEILIGSYEWFFPGGLQVFFVLKSPGVFLNNKVNSDFLKLQHCICLVDLNRQLVGCDACLLIDPRNLIYFLKHLKGKLA